MKKLNFLKVNAKALTALLAVALVLGLAPSAFAQKVGDTVKVSSKDYRVEEVRADGRLLLQLQPKLDGVWVWGNSVITVSGNSGKYTTYNPTSALAKDAEDKGYFKVGTQVWRNLKSTGNLTWSGQTFNTVWNTSDPNVAIGTKWEDATFTMSADGRTLTLGNNAATFTRH